MDYDVNAPQTETTLNLANALELLTENLHKNHQFLRPATTTTDNSPTVVLDMDHRLQLVIKARQALERAARNGEPITTQFISSQIESALAQRNEVAFISRKMEGKTILGISGTARSHHIEGLNHFTKDPAFKEHARIRNELMDQLTNALRISGGATSGEMELVSHGTQDYSKIANVLLQIFANTHELPSSCHGEGLSLSARMTFMARTPALQSFGGHRKLASVGHVPRGVEALMPGGTGSIEEAGQFIGHSVVGAKPGRHRELITPYGHPDARPDIFIIDRKINGTEHYYYDPLVTFFHMMKDSKTAHFGDFSKIKHVREQSPRTSAEMLVSRVASIDAEARQKTEEFARYKKPYLTSVVSEKFLPLN